MGVKISIKTVLDSRQDKEGRSQVFFVLTGSGKRIKLSAGIKVERQYWNNGKIKKGELHSDLKTSMLQARLSVLTKIVAEAEIKMIKPDPEELKQEYIFRTEQPEKKERLSSKHPVTEFIDFYKNQYEKIQKHSTLRSLQQVKNHIEIFDKEVCMEDLHHSWIIKYCDYLIGKGLEDSTIKERHLKSLKFLATEARRHQIQVPIAIDQFKWKAAKKQPFFASWEEVQKIEKLNEFLFPKHEQIRDLFILSCYTGLRESDLHQINKDQIHQQGSKTMLRLVVTKTDLDYSIPLNDTVKKILKKYDFVVPKFSQQEYNREIKHIARAAKVNGVTKIVKSSGNTRKETTVSRYDLFTTHTGRRTFGRRFLDRGGSLIVLSKLFGHKNIETTLKYIGYQPSEIVSEFNKVFD